MAMFTRTLPLLLLCACAATPMPPVVDQPELARMARAYAPQLQAEGITRVVSPGSGAMVRLETGYGPVFVRYPEGVKPLAFVLDVDPEGAQAGAAAAFDRAEYARMLAALVPEAVRAAAESNRLGWLRANPSI
jgi:hypothetical protein